MTGTPEPPKDTKNAVYIIFYWLGIGTLLPWNFFLAVNGYWMYKYREVNATATVSFVDGDDGETVPTADVTKLSDLQLSWGPYLSMSAMIPNVSVLLLNALFGHKGNTTPRLIASLVVIILVFIFSDVMTKVDTDHWQAAFMSATLATVVIFNVMVAILQGGLMGVAGRFPPAYMGAMVQGQALGGIIACTTNIGMLAVGLNDVDAAFYDFLIAILYLVLSLGAFLYVVKTEFYKHYASEGPSESASTAEEEKNPEADQLLEGGGGESDGSSDKKNSADVDVGVRGPTGITRAWAISKRIWVWIVAVFITFFTTLAVYPSITQLAFSTEHDQNTAWARIYFVPVGCFLVFNVGDYVGRLIASWLQWPGPSTRGSLIVLAISVVRISFIPLFIFCNISPNNRYLTKVVFDSDAAYLIFMALFSLTNGYLGNVVMTFGPKMMGSPHEQGQAASILVFFLVFGLAIGSAISPLCVRLL